MDKAAAAPLAAAERRTLVALYAAAVFMYWAALYLYVPTLPVYAEARADSLALVGVILAQYGLWQAIIRLPLGIAADWAGRRKPFILGGFALAATGALTMASADSAAGLLVGRAITGLAAGTWVVLVVSFSSLFPPAEAVRATALLTFVASAARMVATGLTGWLNNLGGYGLAFTLAAGAAALAALAVLPVREQALPPRRPAPHLVRALIFRRDVFLPSALAALTMYAVWGTTFGFFPIQARALGADGVTQSGLTSLNVAASTIGSLLAAAVVRRLGARRMVMLSFAGLSLSVALGALASSLGPLWAAQAIGGLASGMAGPALMGMSIERVGEGERATAMGAHQAIYAIGMFAGPWMSGLLAEAVGVQSMFALTAAATLALGLLGASRMRPAR